MSTFAMRDPHPVMGAVLALAASRRATVELTDETLEVRLGLTWHARIPRASIRAAGHDPLRTISIGAHGWRGDWLVNTSRHGLVVLDLEPPAPGRCLGWPLRVHRLHLSLADPDAFLAALTVPRPAA
ncbi:hypothetical protein [Phycicoccus sp.]|uniref:hypothetical protein n=1 Tax=Phycicoccus sp. TaxID=1902410 RepID=UPI002C7090E0|nr:hypothetical protein [Phycicoccus sp.]HMM95212.1 hypothetical protein [Phycicoccus sp.]